MFKFKLQSVLDYRLNIEEKILNEFSELKRELDRLKAMLEELKSERENMVAGLRNMQSQTIKAHDISSILVYVERLRESEKQQNQVILQTIEAVDQKRKDLVEAVKNRKIMENLKDKQKEEYIKDVNDTEQKDSDEMSVLKFGGREK
ncbi:MAG TPA: flagellar export protein FliJ [Smithellaceae bacterium]|nr:flagellar export protein FliJ [Smithellaceae bacterium]HQF84281.1 flagellar export protein FliJ [Smithellaceae bacterium]HQG80552.1 flagellar export protein FliJ [Smithellaceae bacterium]